MIRASILLSLFLCSTAMGENLTKLNAEWLLKNESRLESDLGQLSDIEAMPIINTLGLIWQYRDGALGGEVSPYIAQALIHKPDLMLAWFQKFPNDFSTWLEELPYALLTNYNGSEAYAHYLNQIKTDLEKSMFKYEGENRILAKKVFDLISKTEVREID